MEGTRWTCLLRLTALILVMLTPSVTPTPAVTSTPSPRPPRLTRCVFQPRNMVTCYWEASEPPARNYTLLVQPVVGTDPVASFTCKTKSTSCTVQTNMSSNFIFCVSITAHLDSGGEPLNKRCKSGMDETMMPPGTLEKVIPHAGNATCLDVTWSVDLTEFPLPNVEIEDEKLKSQIEITAQGQSYVEIQNVTVRNSTFTFPVCSLKPDTSYMLRVRHQYAQAQWGEWSQERKGRTSESAPSAAPAFWSRESPGEQDVWKQVTLHWKPLPHFQANGQVLFFNVTCPGAQLDSCGDLGPDTTLCSLRLPLTGCSCSLTASNSAGTSPEARAWLRSASNQGTSVLPSPWDVAAVPLDNHTLDVRWKAPAGDFSGFVVEWYAARNEGGTVDTHWQRINASRTSLLITEGVQPMQRYVVSVSALYGEGRAGLSETATNYTWQGAPSAGPNVSSESTWSNAIKLSWQPVPMEQRRGFIRNYTLLYWMDKQEAQRESVPADYSSFTLKNLLPGTYTICMQASTDAGAGVNGSTIIVSTTEEEAPVWMFALPALLLILLLLMLIAYVVAKKKLSLKVPNPSKSSLAHWSPKVPLKGGMLPTMAADSVTNISALTLLGERRPLTSSFEEDLSPESSDPQHSHLYYRYSHNSVSEEPGPGWLTHSERSAESSAPKVKLSQFSVWPTESCLRTLPGGPLPLRPLLPLNLLTADLQPGALFATNPKWPRGGVSTQAQAPHGLGEVGPTRGVHTSEDGGPCARSRTLSASDSALFFPLDGLRSFVHPLRLHQSLTAPSQLAELSPGPAEGHSNRPGNLCFPPSALTLPELFAQPQPPSLFVDFSYYKL